ncbi:hypothetical protein M2351_004335 [Azospirillum canadense]|nr:hypothetical protein [Azospirillum canadense]
MLRLAFGRPWRQTEGLLGSLLRLLGLDLPVPDHTTFSRRSANLEVAMLRYKTLIGRSLRARTLPAQKVEAAVGGKVLNIMTSLGMPVSRKVA